ncbi:MAG: GldG family protein [Sandaracinaceae bacterium]
MANSNNGASNQRGARQGAESVVYVLLAVVVLVLANVAGNFIHFRSDWTEANRYSLSQGSENLVSDLNEDMEIVAYFTPDLPQPYNTIEPYVRNLLEEYEAAAGGRLTVTFIDPDEDEEKEQAQADGVQELQHPGYENDSVTVKVGFRGMVIRYLGNRETIPVIQDTRGLEYEISQAIRRLVREPLPVGIVSGHGSPTTAEGLATLTGELEHYEMREVDLSSDVDPALRALLLVNPTEELTEPELRRINAYVMGGGSLGIFGGTMNVSLEGAAPAATQVSTGINTLLEGWGIQMGSSLVADARCGRVPLRTPIGLQIPVAYPPAPIIMFDETQREHPVLFRLNQAPFFFASPLTTTSRFDELNGIVLGRSGEESSWLLTGDSIQLQPRDPREWQIGSETGPHSIMLALSGELPSAFPTAGEGEAAIDAESASTSEVRVLVAGSGAVLRDQFLPSRQRAGQMTGGLAFALNAVDWLAADSDLIAIRAKNIEDPAIDVPQDVRQAQEDFREAVSSAAETGDETGIEAAVEEHDAAMESWESKKSIYRWGIGFGLPIFVILFGLIRFAMRRNQQDRLRALRKSLVAKKG